MSCDPEFVYGLFTGAFGSFVGCSIIYFITLRGNHGS
jgi:hypothetical protein